MAGVGLKHLVLLSLHCLKASLALSLPHVKTPEQLDKLKTRNEEGILELKLSVTHSTIPLFLPILGSSEWLV